MNLGPKIVTLFVIHLFSCFYQNLFSMHASRTSVAKNELQPLDDETTCSDSFSTSHKDCVQTSPKGLQLVKSLDAAKQVRKVEERRWQEREARGEAAVMDFVYRGKRRVLTSDSPLFRLLYERRMKFLEQKEVDVLSIDSPVVGHRNPVAQVLDELERKAEDKRIIAFSPRISPVVEDEEGTGAQLEEETSLAMDRTIFSDAMDENFSIQKE